MIGVCKLLSKCFDNLPPTSSQHARAAGPSKRARPPHVTYSAFIAQGARYDFGESATHPHERRQTLPVAIC